jgi:hypothetical protein
MVTMGVAHGLLRALHPCRITFLGAGYLARFTSVITALWLAGGTWLPAHDNFDRLLRATRALTSQAVFKKLRVPGMASRCSCLPPSR